MRNANQDATASGSGPRRTVLLAALALQPLIGLPSAGQQLLITQVSVGAPEAGQLTIIGRDLDNGPSLEVTLGEIPDPLEVLSWTSDEIVVELPDPLDSGDYLLSVSTGAAARRRDVYDLTVAATAPPGVVPVGAMILWDASNDCPEGFARVSLYDDKFLVGANTPGITGGSDTHTHRAGSYSASAHRHQLERWDRGNPIDDNSGGDNYNTITGEAVGGDIVGSSEPVDSRPRFVTLLLCRRI